MYKNYVKGVFFIVVSVLCLSVAPRAFAGTVTQSIKGGTRGISTLVIEGTLSPHPTTGAYNGTLNWYGGTQQYQEADIKDERTIDFCSVLPYKSVTYNASLLDRSTNTTVTHALTITPDNTPVVTVHQEMFRGVTKPSIEYRFPRTKKTYGFVNIYRNDVTGPIAASPLSAVSNISLSGIVEVTATIPGSSFDTTKMPLRSMPVRIAGRYIGHPSGPENEWIVSDTMIPINNDPVITIQFKTKTGIPLDTSHVVGECIAVIGYTFPSSGIQNASLMATIDGQEKGMKDGIALSFSKETQGTWEIPFSTDDYQGDSHTLAVTSEFCETGNATVKQIFTEKPLMPSPVVEPTMEPPKADTTTVSDPINVADGNMYTTSLDLEVASRELVVKRMYNSRSTYSGMFGYGWRSTYEVSLYEDGEGIVYETDPDGVWTIYTPQESGGYNASAGKESHLVKNEDGSYVLRKKHGSEYVFSPEGKLKTITDRNGNIITMSYTTDGILSEVSDVRGNKLTFSADQDNHIIYVTDQSGRRSSYSYDTEGNCTGVTDPSGHTEHYGYDAEHNITTIIKKNGTPLYFSYDVDDRAHASWQHNNTNVVHLNFTEPGKTIVTDSLGNQTTYEYNDYGLVHTVTDAVGNKEYTGWDDDLNKTYVTDKNGNTTNFAYDDQGNLIQVTDPSAAITTFEYEPLFNQVTRSVDALGNQTLYMYDTKGNITSVTDALGNSTQYTYDTRGNVITTTDARGNSTQFAYDAADNLITVTDALGNQTQFTYDAVGNVLSTIDARGNTTQFEYDALNRVTKVTYADSATVAYRYDAEGNRIGITDAKGNETQFEYDPFQRLIKVIDALSAVTEYAYDTEGNQLSIKDANQHQTSYTYDNLQRLIKEVSALAKEKSIAYDANSNVIEKVDGRGEKIEYTYDAQNRLTSIIYPLSSILYQYDVLGRRTSTTDTHGTTTYTYDALSRLTKVDGPESNDTIQYEYDAVGNRTKMIDQNGKTTMYTYDALNRLISLVDANGDLTTYTYDAVSNLLTVTYPNATTTTYTYDNRNRVVSLVNANTEKTLSSFAYTYDSNGMVTKTTLMNEAYIEYEYDAVNRLIRESKERLNTAQVAIPRYVYEYTYDAVGNRLEMQRLYNKNLFWEYYGVHIPQNVKQYLELYHFGSKDSEFIGPFEKRIKGLPKQPIIETVYEYNEDNELLRLSEDLTYQGVLFDIRDEEYQYDENGNLTQTIDDRQKTVDYTYDYENRLLSVVSGLQSIVYEYDATGKRIQTNDNGTITNYYYDGMSPIIERDQNGSLTASYVRGLGYGGGIGSIISMTTPKDTSTGKVKYKTVYYHYDRMGNVMNLTGAGGNQNAKYTYDAFGNVLQEKGAWSGTNPYRFSTKETDSTGLVYFGARYYNPQVGRWITKDPMGMVDGPNMYNYVNANPVNYIDEWGEFAETPTVGFPGVLINIPIGVKESLPINPNGTEKGNKSTAPSAGVKEEANNPTDQVNKADSGDKEGNAEEQEGNKNKDKKPGRRNTPIKGKPNSIESYPDGKGGRTDRQFGDDGRAILDTDYGHDHGEGDPHGHIWDWSGDKPERR